MLKGDLSNKMLPRIVVVFEAGVGEVPADKEKQFHKAMQKKRYAEAVGYFDLNEIMLRKLLDLKWRKDVNVSIVTWMGDDMASAIAEKMDDEGIPIGECFASTPYKLARSLAYKPDVIAVYDSDDGHVFTYGGKGVVLVDPAQLGSML